MVGMGICFWRCQLLILAGLYFRLIWGKRNSCVLAVCEAMIGGLNGWDGELVARGHFALIKR